MMTRQPVRPFSFVDAVQNVRMAEDAWNFRDSEKVALT
jgi:nuclear transport factor 2 (NTF2) superfamily protein